MNVDAARVGRCPARGTGPGGHPKSKSKVERVVQCVLSNVFAGEEFMDLADAVSGTKITSILDELTTDSSAGRDVSAEGHGREYGVAGV
jgi:hypothetical protein